MKDKIELNFGHASGHDHFFSEFPETADLIKDLLLCRIFDGTGIADIDLRFFRRDHFMPHGTNDPGHRFRSSLTGRTTERFKIDFHSQPAPFSGNDDQNEIRTIKNTSLKTTLKTTLKTR